MNSDLAAIKHEAWAWVNKARKAVGLQPVLFFPASIRNSEEHCVIASTIPLYPDKAEQEFIAESWQTQVVAEMTPSNSDKDYYVHYYTNTYIKLPVAVTRFRNLFNAGHYPELEA